MNVLGEFINRWTPRIMSDGSPGAVRMAMLFLAEEREAERETRLLGGEGELGITAKEVQALDGTGYSYEVNFGAPGERIMPSARSRPLETPHT